MCNGCCRVCSGACGVAEHEIVLMLFILSLVGVVVVIVKANIMLLGCACTGIT